MICYDHEKVELTNRDGDVSRIDSGMVKLVELLISHGIIVRNACEGHALFVDQTHYDARKYRSEIRVVHDDISLAFVRGLIVDSHFFQADKVLWSIEFDSIPFGPTKGEKRITLSFPQQDIDGLVNYISMRESLSNFKMDDFIL